MSRIRITVLAVLVAMPTLAAEIKLREVSTPFGSIVRLGDVADIVADSAAEQQRLIELPLMAAPAPGTQQFVRAEAIRELLEATGQRTDDHRFVGARTVQVRGAEPQQQPYAVERAEPLTPRWRAKPSAGQPELPRQSVGFRGQPTRLSRAPSRLTGLQRRSLTEALVEAANNAVLTAGLPETLRAKHVRVEGLTDSRLRALTGAEATLVDPATVAADRTVAVRFSTGVADETLAVRYEEVSLVVVASRPIRRGELLTSANTELRLADQLENATAPSDAYTALDQVAGLEAKRSLRQGEPLSPATCIGPLLVRRGDPVTVQSGVGMVTVRLRGIARDDGREGDVVSVEVHDRDQLEARVTGHGELAILSGRPSRALTAAYRQGGLR